MSAFSDLDIEGVEEGGDQLGGFQPLESDVYVGDVKVVYMGQAASGSRFLGIHLNINGREYRENVYYTKKTGEVFFIDKNTGKKRPLPGYQICNELCQITTGYELKVQPTEEKVIKLYDYEAKADINQSVQVLTELTGKPVAVGILRQIVDKTTKDAAGVYQPNGDTRTQNVINKFFHAETLGTTTEYAKNLTLGNFHKDWIAQNQGKDDVRAKGLQAAGVAPGRPGQAPAAAPQGGATASLFKR